MKKLIILQIIKAMKGIAAEITKNPTILMKALREELKKNKNPPAIAGLNLFESHDKTVKAFNTQSK